MSVYELGGIAQYPEDIDGDEICFNAFNFCLAEDYYAAMKTEDFEALGHIDRFTFKKIQYWLNYNNELTKEQLEEIRKISIGLIKTENNRTFAEAVIVNRKIDLAIEFIFNGNFDVRLYALTVTYDYDKEAQMILYFPETIKTVQDYIKFV